MKWRAKYFSRAFLVLGCVYFFCAGSNNTAFAQALLYESSGPDTTVKQPYDEGSKAHVTLDPNGFLEEPPKLKQKLKDGTYVYDTKPSPQKQGASVHFGSYSLSHLHNDSGTLTYGQIYNSNSVFIVTADYEYQFLKGFGKLGAKGGIGFFTAKGFGHFVHTPGLASDAQFTIYSIPLSLGPVYHLQFYDRQIVVPFVEAGGDYFGIVEYRDDKTSISDSLRFGGAAAVHWAAGAEIQLDFIDRHGMWQLDHEYGINHIYLIGDMRQIIGASQTFDFSGTIIEGGFLVEF